MEFLKNFNLKGLLQDEEFLLGAGLLTQGAKGQSIGEAAFPSIIQAGKTANYFKTAEAKNDKAKAFKKLLESDQVSDIDKLYLSAGIPVPKKNKPQKTSPSDLGVMVWNKLRDLKGEEFDVALKNLPQVEQDIYAKVIKGNEDWFNSLIKENMKNNNMEMPDLSGFQVTENAQGKTIEEWIKASKSTNQNMSVEEIIEGLISNGIIVRK